jgi:hypothetical protein
MDIIPIIAKVTAEERDEVVFGQWALRGLLIVVLVGIYFGVRYLRRTRRP